MCEKQELQDGDIASAQSADANEKLMFSDALKGVKLVASDNQLMTAGADVAAPCRFTGGSLACSYGRKQTALTCCW